MSTEETPLPRSIAAAFEVGVAWEKVEESTVRELREAGELVPGPGILGTSAGESVNAILVAPARAFRCNACGVQRDAPDVHRWAGFPAALPLVDGTMATVPYCAGAFESTSSARR